MFITIVDIIEDKILHYFDCPSNPNPKRLKLFWYYCLTLLIFCVGVVIGLYIFTAGDKTKLAIIGINLMVVGFGWSYLEKRHKKSNTKTLKWWQGEIPWYHILGL